jgi:energy-coupling factor transporter ATP-binding protein EcfA2
MNQRIKIGDTKLYPEKPEPLPEHGVPFTPWAKFQPILKKNLKEGKHVALLAPNGGGKTTLAVLGVFPHYEDLLIIDSTADPNPPLFEYGEPLNRFGKIEGHKRLTVTDLSSKSREKIFKAMQRAFQQGHCAIYIDEVRQVGEKKYFGLEAQLKYFWLFGRKRGITIIGSSQAPRFLPSEFYDQSKAHFLFKNRDRRAMKRIAEISGDVDTLEKLLPHLNHEAYEFAFVDLAGDVHRSIMEVPEGAGLKAT